MSWLEFTKERARHRVVQRFWNNQMIVTMDKALRAVDTDEPAKVRRRSKRLDEIKWRYRREFELPYNKLMETDAY